MPWLIIVLATAALGAADKDTDSPPVRVVRRLHETFSGVLKQADALGYSGRYERLTPAIAEAFDSEFMASAVIGRQWSQLDEDDRARWVTTFGEFTIANYAARLDHYTGQTFETLGERAGQNQTVFVLARVVDPAGENVSLNYRLRETAAGWKIIDIYAKGTVSELALRRSEYSSVLKQDGFEALVAMLNRKLADLAAGKAAQ